MSGAERTKHRQVSGLKTTGIYSLSQRPEVRGCVCVIPASARSGQLPTRLGLWPRHGSPSSVAAWPSLPVRARRTLSLESGPSHRIQGDLTGLCNLVTPAKTLFQIRPPSQAPGSGGDISLRAAIPPAAGTSLQCPGHLSSQRGGSRRRARPRPACLAGASGQFPSPPGPSFPPVVRELWLLGAFL